MRKAEAWQERWSRSGLVWPCMPIPGVVHQQGSYQDRRERLPPEAIGCSAHFLRFGEGRAASPAGPDQSLGGGGALRRWTGGAESRGGTMKYAIVVVVGCIAAALALPRAKRAAYELPDGAELLLGSVKTSFTCPAKNGYFADVDNNCQIFHVCNVVPKDDGSAEVQQYSFLCGNQTVFNQFSLTCAFPEDAVACRSSPDFFYLNDRIGQEKVNLHDESDVQRALPLIPRYQQQFKA
ncbi:hypothetical protein HPB47_020187 [Ixodes persulcatus]|uniref:Uncharacterized protein n=1 Tax=Ixodes persulcatus TaxID=34615 RepID=A0AC60QG30_IXOPE|nr:hypothetical protein HPB47_020187 [Ixodes persulcatus]